MWILIKSLITSSHRLAKKFTSSQKVSMYKPQWISIIKITNYEFANKKLA